MVTNPTPSAVPPANPPVIWPAATTPTVKILSVNGATAPADPLAPVTGNADLNITPSTAEVIVQTGNFPPSGVVQVRAVQKYGPATWTTATLVAGGTYASANWRIAAMPFTPGYTTLQAKATVP